MADLFPYQIEGAGWLASRQRAMLADDMGLGKTAQAVQAAAWVCDPLFGGHVTVAVVCPASLRETWRREFKRFWSGSAGTYDLTVESYDKVARGALDGISPDILILDEAHYLKTRTARRTQTIYGRKCHGDGLVGRAKYVWALTGTPAPNNPSELWTHLRALAPETIPNDKRADGRPLAYWDFVGRYCVTRETGFGIQIVKGKNLAQLKQQLHPVLLRRRKEDVLTDLPPLRYGPLYLEGEAPTGVYEENLIAAALEKDGIDGLQKIAPHVATLRRLTGLAKIEPTVAWVQDWFECGGGKLVLFAHHRDVVSGLADRLRDYGSVWVQGDTHLDVRQKQVDSFQHDPKCRVFIGQIQAAGTGLTLTAASDLVFVESSWVPAENLQAAMRIHRIGQQNACTVRFATLAGSIDERVQAAVERKMKDLEILFG